MSNLGQVMIGGVLPAFLWGLTAILQKLSAQSHTPPGQYMAVFGGAICVAGVIYSLAARDSTFSPPGLAFSALAGVTFSAGTWLISFTLWKFGTPISRLAPILSANVLVTVLIGLFVLHEYVPPVRLIGGAVLIVLGVVLVSGT